MRMCNYIEAVVPTRGRHANVTRSRKLKIYEACVVSRLLYGLHTSWLNEAEKKRLDAFHVRCLRQICGIQDAYFSRVSNARVLETAASKPMRDWLLDQQLQLYGHVARKEDGDPVREATLQTSTVRPRRHEGRRRVGRPRHQWNNEVFRVCLQVAGSTEHLAALLSNNDGARREWKTATKYYMNKL